MKTFHTWEGYFENNSLWPAVRGVGSNPEVKAVLVTFITLGERKRSFEQVLLTAWPGGGQHELAAFIERCSGQLPLPFEGELCIEVGPAGASEPEEIRVELAVGALRTRQRDLTAKESMHRQAAAERRLESVMRLAVSMMEANVDTIHGSASIVRAVGEVSGAPGGPQDHTPRPRGETLLSAALEGVARGLRDPSGLPTSARAQLPVRQVRARVQTTLGFAESNGHAGLKQLLAGAQGIGGPGQSLEQVRQAYEELVAKLEAAHAESPEDEILSRAHELLTGVSSKTTAAEEEAPTPRRKGRAKGGARRRGGGGRAAEPKPPPRGGPKGPSEGSSAPRGQAVDTPQHDQASLPEGLRILARDACHRCAPALVHAAALLEDEGLGEERGHERLDTAAKAVDLLLPARRGCQYRGEEAPPSKTGVGLLMSFGWTVADGRGSLILPPVGAPYDSALYEGPPEYSVDGRYRVVKLLRTGWTCAEEWLPAQVELGLPVLFASEGFPGLRGALAQLLSKVPPSDKELFKEAGRQLLVAAAAPPREACKGGYRVMRRIVSRVAAEPSPGDPFQLLYKLAEKVLSQAGGALLVPQRGNPIDSSLHRLIGVAGERVGEVIEPGVVLDGRHLLRRAVVRALSEEESEPVGT